MWERGTSSPKLKLSALAQQPNPLEAERERRMGQQSWKKKKKGDDINFTPVVVFIPRQLRDRRSCWEAMGAGGAGTCTLRPLGEGEGDAGSFPLSIPQPGPAAAGEGRKENPPGPGLPTTTGLSCGAAACTASLQMYYLLVAKGRWKCDLADGRCDH